MCNYYTILDKNLITVKINFSLTYVIQTTLHSAMLHCTEKIRSNFYEFEAEKTWDEWRSFK